MVVAGGESAATFGSLVAGKVRLFCSFGILSCGVSFDFVTDGVSSNVLRKSSTLVLIGS